MPTKFVVRLLDAEDALLAWSEVSADPSPQAPRGASCPFFAPGPTLFPIERAGRAVKITVHWCDLDVARLATPIAPLEVVVGQVVRYDWIEPLWLVPGMRDVPLPAVTVRAPIAIGVPSGAVIGAGAL